MKKMKNEEKKIAHCLIFFYKKAATGGALQKKVFLKISKIHRKITVLECLIFNKAPIPQSLQKKRQTPTHVFSCSFCEILKMFSLSYERN